MRLYVLSAWVPARCGVYLLSHFLCGVFEGDFVVYARRFDIRPSRFLDQLLHPLVLLVHVIRLDIVRVPVVDQ